MFYTITLSGHTAYELMPVTNPLDSLASTGQCLQVDDVPAPEPGSGGGTPWPVHESADTPCSGRGTPIGARRELAQSKLSQPRGNSAAMRAVSARCALVARARGGTRLRDGIIAKRISRFR